MKMRDARLQRLSDFYCTYCGHRSYPILRRVGKEREPGHLKNLFCLYCNQERNMVEIKAGGKYTYYNFLEEFIGKNFDEKGNRKKPYKQFVHEMIKTDQWNILQDKIQNWTMEEKYL